MASLKSIVFAAVMVTTVAVAQPRSANFVPPGPLRLLPLAYPGVIKGVDGNTVVFADGFRLDAGTVDPAATFDSLVRHASVRDMFRLVYPAGQPPSVPAVNFDPGRFRSKALFDHLYGDCHKGEVEPRLEAVTWLPASWGHTLMVTRVNGIAARFREVSAEIERLPPPIRRGAYPSAGTYVCRGVADAGQPSMHAYGAAIDLNLDVSDYWMWQNGGRSPLSRSRMPREIIDIFERHGFIWGGRWYHYDTMHFEYRPELLPLSRATLPH
jgi:hypothetical protein